jgi:exosortase A
MSSPIAETPFLALDDNARPRLLAWGALLLLLLGALYADTFRHMAAQWWKDEDYNHGFIVPLFSAYLLWQERERLKRVGVAQSGAGLLVVALGLMLFSLGALGAELFLQRASFIVVLAGLVLVALGPALLRAVAFPIGFLVFMVPIPAVIRNVIAFPLQLFAAQTATVCLSGAGIPVLREGNVIVLAETTLEVADACSGIRSLQALVALATVYAYLTQRSWWKRLLLVLAALPIAIVANAFRVSGTGFLAHFWGLQVAQGFYHSLAGYLMFGVAFLGLLLCGTILSRVAPDRPAGKSPAA